MKQNIEDIANSKDIEDIPLTREPVIEPINPKHDELLRTYDNLHYIFGVPAILGLLAAGPVASKSDPYIGIALGVIGVCSMALSFVSAIKIGEREEFIQAFNTNLNKNPAHPDPLSYKGGFSR